MVELGARIRDLRVERGHRRRELARTLRALGDLLCDQDRLTEAAQVLRSGLLDLERIGRNP